QQAADVAGVMALALETGEIYVLEAKQPVLATGGAGRIWAASTNAFINTGDGLGITARAGLPLEDMEFWQFHPTGVAGAGVLITEGVRGEGGHLRNKDGERFMERYAPTVKGLAGRGGVARARAPGTQEGRGASEGGYLLNKDGERVMERYAPTVKDLASRDVVSRAMATEIKEGRGAGKDGEYILLKLDHLGADVINKRLPGIREIALKFANVD